MTHIVNVRNGLNTVTVTLPSGSTAAGVLPSLPWGIELDKYSLRTVPDRRVLGWETSLRGTRSVVLFPLVGEGKRQGVCSAAVLGDALVAQPRYFVQPAGHSLCAYCAVTCHGLEGVGIPVHVEQTVDAFTCGCHATGRCCWAPASSPLGTEATRSALRKSLGGRLRRERSMVAWVHARANEGDASLQNDAETQFTMQVQQSVRFAMQYYSPDAQAAARSVIPMDAIRSAAGGDSATDKSVLMELLRWFKYEFFKWAGTIPCESCGKGTGNVGSMRPNGEEMRHGAGIVEAHKCGECQHVTRFPRYNDPVKLLQTRRGHCGEWANCFTLCCIALGFEARHVVDHTDHVWTEVWVEDMGRWVHMDPCESRFDAPLMYEGGWGKKLTYVIAYSNEGVVDVTRRYTKKFAELKRMAVSEEGLSRILTRETQRLRSLLSPERRALVEARATAEETELSSGIASDRQLRASEEGGRTTGSWQWRAARGELGPNPTKE